MKKLIAIILALMFCVTLISGCDNSQPVQVMTLNLVIEGETQTMEVKLGEPLSIENPQKDGCSFDGWYDNASFTGERVDISTLSITEDMTLYAKFIKNRIITKINSVEDFLHMEEGDYSLECDLDFSGVAFESLGNRKEPFSGYLNGNGHTVKNIEGAISIFGVVSGTIENLNVEYSIEDHDLADTVYSGGIVGYLLGGKILGCSAKVNLNLTSTDNRLSVYAGGIAGRVSNGTIEKCTAYSEISVNNISEVYVGGIVGYVGGEGNQKSQVTSCVHYGSVCGETNRDKSSAYVGGITGYNAGIIKDCIDNSSTITGRCTTYYAYVGGIVGDNNSGRVHCCISTADVTAKSNGGDLYVGGIAGHNFLDYELEECYGFDGQTITAISEVDGARKVYVPCKTVSKSQLISANWYQNIELDGFVLEDGFLPYMEGMQKHEFTKSAPYGSIGNPIRISSLQQLKEIEKDKAYVLTCDIDVGKWTPIGSYTDPFTGCLDGNGYTLLNVQVENESNYVGLFGYLNGQVKNLNINIEYAQQNEVKGRLFAGGISAYSENAVIYNCTSNTNFVLQTSNVTASAVCAFADGGRIESCQVSGDIEIFASERSVNVGGICGVSEKTVINHCINNVGIKGALSLGGFIGGIVGKNNGEINNCASLSSIEAICNGNNEECDLVVGGVAGTNLGVIKGSCSTIAVEVNGSCLLVSGTFCGSNYGSIDGYALMQEGMMTLGYSAVATQITICDQEKIEGILADILIINDNSSLDISEIDGGLQ